MILLTALPEVRRDRHHLDPDAQVKIQVDRTDVTPVELEQLVVEYPLAPGDRHPPAPVARAGGDAKPLWMNCLGEPDAALHPSPSLVFHPDHRAIAQALLLSGIRIDRNGVRERIELSRLVQPRVLPGIAVGMDAVAVVERVQIEPRRRAVVRQAGKKI